MTLAFSEFPAGARWSAEARKFDIINHSVDRALHAQLLPNTCNAAPKICNKSNLARNVKKIQSIQGLAQHDFARETNRINKWTKVNSAIATTPFIREIQPTLGRHVL